MRIYHEGGKKNIEKSLKIIRRELFSIAATYKCDHLKFEFNLDKKIKCIKLNITEYTELD